MNLVELPLQQLSLRPVHAVFGECDELLGLLTTDTLFPFSQVTLAHTARELQGRHQTGVEVIGIQAQSL